MQQRSLEALLEGHTAIAAHGRDPRFQSFADAATCVNVDLALGLVDAASLVPTVEVLVRAVRPRGTVLVVTKAPGLFGLGARGAPDPSEVSEALLRAGVVELSAALTPGTLRKELLVWGTRLGE